MRRTKIKPGAKSLERRSTFAAEPKPLERRTELARVSERRAEERPRRRSTLKQGRGFAASEAQRAKVRGRCSIVSGEDGCDAAHVWPRGLGGCDSDLCVVPLTRAEHRSYDDDDLDLLPYLIAHGCVDELAHALTHSRGDLIGLLQVLTGCRWAPESSTPNEGRPRDRAGH